jgi:hypothetical protein
MSAHQRIVLWIALAGFTAFGLAGVLYAYLIEISPISPDPGSGRVSAMHEHGYIFFVTPHQRLAFFTLLTLFGVLVLIATLLSAYWMDIPRPKSISELFRRTI